MPRNCLPLLTSAFLLLIISCLSVGRRPEAGTSDPPGSRLAKYGIVLPVGPYGSWDSGMVESPVVWYDSIQGKYGMVYTGYESLDSAKRGAESCHETSGGTLPGATIFCTGRRFRGIRSSEEAASPVLLTRRARLVLSCGWRTRRYLFYFGVTAKGYEKGMKTMNLALSTDLHTWKRFIRQSDHLPFRNGWLRDAIWHPNVVRTRIATTSSSMHQEWSTGSPRNSSGTQSLRTSFTGKSTMLVLP